ncbi:MAG: hypothetical protein ACRENP_25765 [Longimicrobiales bacterium]
MILRLLRSAHALCARTVRAEFDEFCLQRTVERGAEGRVIRHIVGLNEDRTVVQLDTSEGSLRGTYLVGADGANSVVRRLLPGLGHTACGFAIEAHVPLCVASLLAFDFGVVEYGYGWVFPKGDHANVGLYSNSTRWRPDRAALAEYGQQRLGVSDLSQVVGHPVGLHGSNVLATSRIALAGDAAGLCDPLLGEGIHNALASGQAAAAAIDRAGQTGRPLNTVYATALEPVLRDLRISRRAARRFYRHLDFGYRVLRTTVIRAALVKGRARGMTFSDTTHRFFLLPLLRVKPWVHDAARA